MEDFHWSTQEPHFDNAQTMTEYLELHLANGFDPIFQDGSYAEIQNENGTIYGVHASGNGDSFNHKVRFEFIH